MIDNIKLSVIIVDMKSTLEIRFKEAALTSVEPLFMWRKYDKNK